MMLLTARSLRILALIGLFSALAAPAAAQAKYRVAALTLVHESNVFLRNETTYEDFIFAGSPMRGQEVLDQGGEMAGFVQMMREMGGVELIGIESPREPKTGMGSGWVQKAAYDKLIDRMIKELKSKGPFDGVYLLLHGAMSVRDVP